MSIKFTVSLHIDDQEIVQHIAEITPTAPYQKDRAKREAAQIIRQLENLRLDCELNYLTTSEKDGVVTVDRVDRIKHRHP